MATTLNDPELYERDFHLWTQRQAAELRRAAEAGSNLPLDWLHLAEEIESLGERDRREFYSRLVRVIEHLLKLQFCPSAEPRRSWRISVLNQRGDLARLLKSSPSLRRFAESYVREAYEEASGIVERAIPDPELGLWPDLPRICPYPLDQLLDLDFWPEPDHP
ncbi:DUF29 domain-containing protein [Benzoatithermus flavus]|uniref:DUF29 domain-containing protein n=1 Tax=Benzoatithermus flavus TaxID=3108223 RepID=A0ABU8XQJ1_9PROT